MYGKNNNSNRKSIIPSYCGLRRQPVAASSCRCSIQQLPQKTSNLIHDWQLPEVENKQLSLWDLGLLELYGKNNNSNRKSITPSYCGLRRQPVAASSHRRSVQQCRSKPQIKYTISNCKCKMASFRPHHCWLYQRLGAVGANIKWHHIDS